MNYPLHEEFEFKSDRSKKDVLQTLKYNTMDGKPFQRLFFSQQGKLFCGFIRGDEFTLSRNTIFIDPTLSVIKGTIANDEDGTVIKGRVQAKLAITVGLLIIGIVVLGFFISNILNGRSLNISMFFPLNIVCLSFCYYFISFRYTAKKSIDALEKIMDANKSNA